MKKQTLLTVILFGIMVLMLSCDGDSPSGPNGKHEPDYHVLYSYVNGSSYYTVITYSLKYGTVVDSTFYACDPFKDVAYSPDAEYACYTRRATFGCENTRATWVTRTRQGDTVAIRYDYGGRDVEISPDGQYVVISEAKYLAVLRVPDLSAVYVGDSASYSFAVFHPFEHKMYFSTYWDSLISELTFDSMGVVSITSSPLATRTGEALYGGPKSVSPDGEYLIMDVTEKYGSHYVLVMQTDNFEVVHEFSIASWQDHWWYAWHPDGKRLFMSYNSAPDVPYYGGVDVYNVTTGVLQNFINDSEVNIRSGIFFPTHLQFTPEGDKLVILCGGVLDGPSPVVTVDMTTDTIIQEFESPPSGWARSMSLIPIDWERED